MDVSVSLHQIRDQFLDAEKVCRNPISASVPPPEPFAAVVQDCIPTESGGPLSRLSAAELRRKNSVIRRHRLPIPEYCHGPRSSRLPSSRNAVRLSVNPARRFCWQLDERVPPHLPNPADSKLPATERTACVGLGETPQRGGRISPSPAKHNDLRSFTVGPGNELSNFRARVGTSAMADRGSDEDLMKQASTAAAVWSELFPNRTIDCHYCGVSIRRYEQPALAVSTPTKTASIAPHKPH